MTYRVLFWLQDLPNGRIDRYLGVRDAGTFDTEEHAHKAATSVLQRRDVDRVEVVQVNTVMRAVE